MTYMLRFKTSVSPEDWQVENNLKNDIGFVV